MQIMAKTKNVILTPKLVFTSLCSTFFNDNECFLISFASGVRYVYNCPKTVRQIKIQVLQRTLIMFSHFFMFSNSRAGSALVFLEKTTFHSANHNGKC